MRSFLLVLMGSFIACAVLIVLLFFFLVSGYTFIIFSGLILPGVSTAGVDLSLVTSDRAAIEIHKRWSLEPSITVSDGIHEFELSPGDLGINVNALETANKAYNYGREGDYILRIERLVNSIQIKHDVPLDVQLDPSKAANTLNQLALLMNSPPENAGIKAEGADLIAVPARYGYTIDIDKTIELIETDPLSVLTANFVQIVQKPLIPDITDVSGVLEEANRLVQSQTMIHAYDPIANHTESRQITPEIKASWLVIQHSDTGPVVNLDQDKIGQHLIEYEKQLGEGRYIDRSMHTERLMNAIKTGQDIHIQMRHKPASYVIQPGDTMIKIGWNTGIPYWMILNANPDVDPDSLIAGQVITLPSKDELLPNPVIPNKRIVISISKQRLSVYENGDLLSKHVISTGIDRSPTQPGVFQVQSHEENAYASVWDLYMPHFLGIYEAWPGFMNGIHGLPTLSSGRRLWGNVLGRPASYGCIIMELDAAEWLYHWAENGVIVEIEP